MSEATAHLDDVIAAHRMTLTAFPNTKPEVCRTGTADTLLIRYSRSTLAAMLAVAVDRLCRAP